MDAKQYSVTNRIDSLSVPGRLLQGDFAGWLRDAMASRRMSQRMLAALSGIDHSTISRLLKGERQPSLGTALALIRILERPPLRVASDESDPQVHDTVAGEAALAD